MNLRRVTPLSERFWQYVDRSGGANACWPWTGATARGYGRVNRGRRGEGMVQAHRVAFELEHGEIPSDSQVLHHCDNPLCCNRKHLYAGTHADNMRDMVVRGRAASGARNGSYTHPENRPRGETHGNARLSDAAVAGIRHRAALGETQRALAVEFAVRESMVSMIVNGKRRSAVKVRNGG